MSLFWHDYETFGANPRLDRPAQFAGQRTDHNLKLIGDPVNFYCKLADDYLPHPEACLVTGITPQLANAKGLCEAEFMSEVLREMAQPNTCTVGYNSIRFDDEVTRHCLYRNFHDAYGREWQNGNSRWDLINVARLVYALRPEGIEWPVVDEKPSFRLENLTAANNISHQGAHDAMADVHATIDLARLIKTSQPRLFDYCFRQRKKRESMAMLDLANRTPILHVSSRISAKRGCLGLMAPIAIEPGNNNAVICVDLHQDPEQWLDLQADEIQDRLFCPQADLPDGVERAAIKSIHVNRAPIIAPVATLKGVDLQRIDFDYEKCLAHWHKLAKRPGLAEKLQAVFERPAFPERDDVDLLLYGGDFFGAADKALMREIHNTQPDALGSRSWDFQDGRLEEMLFRYRARNFPDSLNAPERDRWNGFRRQRFSGLEEGFLGTDELAACLADSRQKNGGDPERTAILNKVEAWAELLTVSLS